MRKAFWKDSWSLYHDEKGIGLFGPSMSLLSENEFYNMYKMITRVLTHLDKSFYLAFVVFLCSSWAVQAQDVSYTCRCKETLSDGVIEFKIRAFGDTNSTFTLENAVNLFFDEDLTMPITDGTMVPDVGAPGGNENFCFTGFSSDGILPTVDVVEDGDASVNLQMLTCRTPEVEIRPEEPDPATLCAGSLRRFCIEDLFGSLTNIAWTAVGSSTITQTPDGRCADIEYAAAGSYVISVSGETATGCAFTDDLIVVVEDLSDDFELQGDCDIYTCSESVDQNYVLAGSSGDSTIFKLYLNDGMGGLGALLNGLAATGSGTGSGSGPTMTESPITFPATDEDYILVACDANPNPSACGFEVRKEISVRTSVDYAVVTGPSCTCIDVPHLYSLENTTDYSGVTWTVSPTAGASIDPSSGVSPSVNVTFSTAGSYTITASGTVAAGAPNAGCPFSTDYAVEVTDQQVNFIACNNNVNVSLNNNCELDITPDMILEGNHLCNDAYNLIVTDASGMVITGAITQDLLGETLTVTVEQDCGNNSCWGNLTVEDKSVTPLVCPAGPISTLCFEFDDFSDFDAIVGLPLFDAGVTAVFQSASNNWLVSGHDNCSDVILEYSDNNTSDDCAAVQNVQRTWTITDVTNGGTNSCSVDLSVVSLMTDAIQWPKNWDSALDTSLVSSCPSLDACNLNNPSELPCSVYTLDSAGNPHPDCTGTPTGLLCSNLQIIGYVDTTLPVCGPSKKILRNWTVWDECNQVESKHTQIITLMTLSTPTCIAAQDLAFSSGNHSCMGSIVIPPPIIDGGCLPVTYTVTYNYVRGVFDPSQFISDGVSSDASDLGNSITIDNIDFSNDSIWIRYVVMDECGNTIPGNGCILEGSLDDNEQPVPACDLNNIVALNEDGCAYAGPSTFDDHSWDNCGIYQTVIQRMDQNNCNNFCNIGTDCELRQFDFMRYLGEHNGHFYYMSREKVRSQFANAYADALAATPNGGNEGGLVDIDNTAEDTWVAAQVALYTNDAYHTQQTHAQYLNNTGGAPGFPGQNFYGRYIVEFNTRCGWTQQEKFCCSDCGEETMMMMRVIDNYGNHNFCMVNVKVEDYIAPTFTSCPQDVTVDCDTNVSFDTNSLNAQFGSPVATDFECSTPQVTPSTHTDPRDECSKGSFTRTWSVKDKSGNSGGTCSQRITFANQDPFVRADISWPADADITSGCTLEDIDPLSLPVASQGPTWTDKSCSTVVSNYSDLLFTIVDGACQKLVRTWSVVDWCNPTVIHTHDQIIKLTNTTVPIVSCPSGTTEGPFINCQRSITGLEATIGGGDACTASLLWSHTIQASGGTPVTRNGNSANGTYTVGNTTIIFTVTDACGNTGSCTTTVSVSDDTAPTPYCHGELVVPISTEAGVDIWASDIDLGSSDDCSSDVTLSFSATSVITSMTFTCNDLGSNDVVLYVQDGNNVASCISRVIVQDNIGVCNVGTRPLANILGNIRTEDAKVVDDVEVNLMSTVVATPMIDMSEQGEYAFMQVPMYEDYQVLPVSDDSYLNGVSTLDLIMIQRHILGLESLDSPYKVIAADINNSQRIDGLDLVELRKLILGIYTELPQNDSWRFVDSDYTFSVPMSPWPYSEDVVVTNISTDISDADFIGVKIGDVNLSAVTSSAQAELKNRNREEFEIDVIAIATDKGNTRIQLVATSDVMLAGTQLSYKFTSPELLALVPMALELGDENIAWDAADNGVFKLSWNTQDAASINKGEVLIECLLKGKDATVSLDESFDSEVYIANGSSLETKTIVLTQPDALVADEFTVDQNIPNPFKDVTVISFNMPNSGKATLTLTDVDGKLINRIERHFNSGFNQISLSGDDIPTSGVVYYHLNVGGETITKKMIVLK